MSSEIEEVGQRALPIFDSGDALLAFDAGLRVVGWNDSFVRLTGLEPDEIQGKPCWAVVRGSGLDGAPVCEEGCTIGRDAVHGRPRASLCMAVATAEGDRRVSMSTLATSFGSARVFVHAFANPARPDCDGEALKAPLTPRQREVLRLLGDGLGTREIAARLTLSEQTVKNHVRAVLSALGCHTRLEAVLKAQRLRLL